VVAERLRKLDFRNPQTMKLEHSTPVPCRGVDHIDFSADGTYFIASCEFSAEVLKVDVASRQVVGKLSLKAGSMPQDVKLSPDGKVFYVADMHHDGIYLIDGEAFKEIGFLPTGKGAQWPVRQPRLQGALRIESRGRKRVRGGFRDAEGGAQMGLSKRRQPGHGRCLVGWKSPLAGRPV